MFIGQAMPRSKKDLHDWPSLNAWLYSIGISDKDIKLNFFYSARVDYFPGAKNGSHRVPTPTEIRKERNRLKKTIEEFDPEIVVTIGKLSLFHCLDERVNLLNDHIGKLFRTDPYKLLGRELLVIPLPHPSGASTWYKKTENKKLLTKALKLLKENL
jgi:uracil-DNA glycosylase